MSEENVETVRRVYELFNEEGPEGAIVLSPPDVVWYPFPEWIEKPEYRGHDGIREVVAVWTDNFDEFAVEVEELRDLGDRVVALTIQSGKIKGTGSPVRQPVGVVYSGFRDGMVGEARFFQSWEEALAVADA
jgi:ketosteroid isomerase-like protein